MFEAEDFEERRMHTLYGQVDEMLIGKTKIETADILKPCDDGSPVSLVFVDGPPGIGKSTLAWELCRRWDRKQYDLAVLLRLREREVQQIRNIANLFPHVDQDLQKTVAKYVVHREGKGVLFILDGYDELPNDMRCRGLLVKLIKGEVFPKCSVLVTSRTSATKDLFKNCRPQIQRLVTILGFTQEGVKHYASSIFSSEPEVLQDFLFYISASQNPAINSLMYIPLNAGIIMEIYRNSRKKGCPIPKTLTQVYTQLCLTLLQRHLDLQNSPTIKRFSDLPSTYYAHFKILSRLAYQQFKQHRMVFYSDSVPEFLVHFGFLDSVTALYGGGEVSYNFLHLTLQEFLAAYYITLLPNGIDVFKRHSENKRWDVVWRFVSGLTSFRFFQDIFRSEASTTVTNDLVKVENFLLHCLFEGQVNNIIDFKTAFGHCAFSSLQLHSSLLDKYVLGYCIANSSSATLWEVKIWGGSDESFIWGLNSNSYIAHNRSGTIHHLHLLSMKNSLHEYPRSILGDINSLDISTSSSVLSDLLVHAIPLMKNLNTLSIPGLGASTMDIELLRIISLSNVVNLKLLCHDSAVSNQRFLASLADLVSSESGKLRFLTLRASLLCNKKSLCDILFGPSSLNKLTLEGIADDCFNLLETNTCLTSVRLEGSIFHVAPFQTFSKVLKRNKTLQNIYAEVGVIHLELFDFEQVKKFNAALTTNTTLKEFFLLIIKPRQEDLAQVHVLSSIRDSRVRIKL